MYRTDAFISRTKVLLQTVLYIYAGCLCLLIFCVMKLRLGKKSNSACRTSSMATWNMAIFLEGISCILIFSFAGRYLVTVAANEACAILPEISRLLPFSSLQPVLTGIGISAFFGIAGTILSLKVEE
jgi:hypothetical protein